MRTKIERALARPDAIGPYLREHGTAVKRMITEGRLVEAGAYLTALLFPRAYPRYLRWIAEDGVIRRRVLGWDMYLPVADEGISRELAWRRVHEPRSTEVFRAELQRLSEERSTVTVLEAGANIGYFCLLELAVLGETARMLAVEPIPENAELLRRNLRLNGYDDVDVHQLALSDHDDVDTMYLSEKRNWSRVGRTPKRYDCERIPVETRTADGFARERGIEPSDVNVVRMDVQGYETHVVRGMREILSADGPLLVFIEIHAEVGERGELDEVIDPLVENDFELSTAHTKAYFKSFVELDSLSDIYEFDFGEWDTIQLICRRD